MASKKPITFKVGRDARDGRFETVDRLVKILLIMLSKQFAPITVDEEKK